MNGVKIPELCVSKSHAKLSYDKAEQCFTLTDMGSVNGSSLNNHRLSKVRCMYSVSICKLIAIL